MEKVLCKSLTIAAIAFGCLCCRAAVANDPVVARYHFVGTSQLAGKGFDNTRKLLNQPSSVEYRNLVLNRFAGEIAASVLGKNSATTIRPLLDDLLADESTGVFGVPGAAPESFVVAVRLPNDRAAAWKQALGNSVSVHQEGDWLIVARGTALKAFEDNFTAEIRKNHRPIPASKDSVLEANVDWPRLSNLPALAAFPFKPAVLQLKVTPKGDHLRTEVHAHYSEPIAWKSKQWLLPTETIRDPLVSFTAGQDVAAFMKPSELAQRIGENPFTNEFYLWANLSVPFQTGLLFPMKNAQRHLQSLGRELPAKFNPELKATYNGELQWLEKTNELIWKGVPILAPFAKAIHEKAGEFLFVGTFAIVTGPPAPQDLWSQFKRRKDLVYYDWEIAGPRLLQWRMLTPLLPIFPMKRINEQSLPRPAKSNVADKSPLGVVDRWLTAVSTGLTPTKENQSIGNVVTEVTRNGATDYTVVRSSQLGFTGVELFMLSHWLADTHPTKVRRPAEPLPGMKQGHVRKPAK